jgi:hypothetical protein
MSGINIIIHFLHTFKNLVQSSLSFSCTQPLSILLVTKAAVTNDPQVFPAISVLSHTLECSALLYAWCIVDTV